MSTGDSREDSKRPQERPDDRAHQLPNDECQQLLAEALALCRLSGALQAHGVLFCDGERRAAAFWLELTPPAACLGWVLRRGEDRRWQASARPAELWSLPPATEELAALALLRALALAFPLELALLALERDAAGSGWLAGEAAPPIPKPLQALWKEAQRLGLDRTGWRQLLHQLGGFSEARLLRALQVIEPAVVARLNAGLPSLEEEAWFAAAESRRQTHGWQGHGRRLVTAGPSRPPARDLLLPPPPPPPPPLPPRNKALAAGQNGNLPKHTCTTPDRLASHAPVTGSCANSTSLHSDRPDPLVSLS